MHDEIRRFSISGEIGEPNLVKTKERLVSFLEGVMRDQSYVPALDLEPQFTLNWLESRKSFIFELTVYGTKVDRAKAWAVSGIMAGTEIPSYTQKSK